jgi:hypothetical protein
MTENIPLIVLLEEINKAFDEFGTIEAKIKENDVKKFYEITKNSDFQYQEKGIVSPEYFMTLLAPLATKVMLKVMGLENIPKIRGVIHSESEVNFFKPLMYDTYIIRSQVESLKQKTGKMGDYLVFTFRLSVFDQHGDEVGNDIHQFFLRVKKEVA